jgi:hypothetical protein
MKTILRKGSYGTLSRSQEAEELNEHHPEAVRPFGRGSIKPIK